MSHLVYPGATHRRFEHSLGVMELASRVFDVITQQNNVHKEIGDLIPEISQPDKKQYWRRVLRMAALCHDFGHIPFSHAAENALLPEEWDHERLTVETIRSAAMEDIWSQVTPPLRSDDIAKLAVGPKKFKKQEFTDWEAVLSEIIVGDAFGVDRIDYLLRDSHHTGVAYGKFDHFRLIDTLRILPSAGGSGEQRSAEPQLGVEEGGLHSAEALLLARYFMFTQVYYHPIRRIYDIHLQDFLSQTLPGGKFPISVDEHLQSTDVEVTAGLRQASKNTDAPGHDHAMRIIRREHFKLLYGKSPQDLKVNPEPGRAIFEATCKKFGDASVRRDFGTAPGGVTDFPVLERDDRVVSALTESDVLRTLPAAGFDYTFVRPDLVDEASAWLDAEREDILREAGKED